MTYRIIIFIAIILASWPWQVSCQPAILLAAETPNGSGGSTFIDQYPGASLAVSLRLLNSNYSGPLIRLKNNSSQEEDFYPNSSNVIALDSQNSGATQTISSFCGSGNCDVTIWYDQSGNGRDLADGTSSPRLIVNGSFYTVNGQPAIYLLGDNKELDNAFAPDHANLTALVVCSYVNYGRGIAATLSTGSSQIYMPYSPGNLNPFQFWYGISGSIATATFTTDQRLYSLFANGSTATYYSNSASIGSTTATSGISAAGLTLGADNSGGFDLDGYLQEFILYDSSQDSNRSGMEADINTFYTIY